jgi:hypothetical protein
LENPIAARAGQKVFDIMEALATPEKIFAGIFAVVIGVFALIALRADWKTTGLDNNVTKLLLGLMAFGCVLVLVAAFGILPRGGS